MRLADSGAVPSPKLGELFLPASPEEDMMRILEAESPPDPLNSHLQPTLHIMQAFQQDCIKQGLIEEALNVQSHIDKYILQGIRKLEEEYSKR
jgi:hypothetical protein